MRSDQSFGWRSTGVLSISALAGIGMTDPADVRFKLGRSLGSLWQGV